MATTHRVILVSNRSRRSPRASLEGGAAGTSQAVRVSMCDMQATWPREPHRCEARQRNEMWPATSPASRWMQSNQTHVGEEQDMPDSGQDEEQRNTSHADNGVAASTTGEEGLVVWCVCVRARAVCHGTLPSSAMAAVPSS